MAEKMKAERRHCSRLKETKQAYWSNVFVDLTWTLSWTWIFKQSGIFVYGLDNR